jgi:hypothetical protein
VNLLELIGETPDHTYIFIDCLDRDLSRLAFCEMYFGMSPGPLVTTSVPAKSVQQWPYYERALTTFIKAHVVQKGSG